MEGARQHRGVTRGGGGGERGERRERARFAARPSIDGCTKCRISPRPTTPGFFPPRRGKSRPTSRRRPPWFGRVCVSGMGRGVRCAGLGSPSPICFFLFRAAAGDVCVRFPGLGTWLGTSVFLFRARSESKNNTHTQNMAPPTAAQAGDVNLSGLDPATALPSTDTIQAVSDWLVRAFPRARDQTKQNCGGMRAASEPATPSQPPPTLLSHKSSLSRLRAVPGGQRQAHRRRRRPVRRWSGRRSGGVPIQAARQPDVAGRGRRRERRRRGRGAVVERDRGESKCVSLGEESVRVWGRCSVLVVCSGSTLFLCVLSRAGRERGRKGREEKGLTSRPPTAAASAEKKKRRRMAAAHHTSLA
jgi:hypothetical protein